MDKRGLLTIAVSAAALLLYFKFIMPLISPESARRMRGQGDSAAATTTAAPQPAATATAAPRPALKPALPQPAAHGAGALPAPSKLTPQTPEVPEKEFVVETKLYRATWTNRGAALKSLVLKEYKKMRGDSRAGDRDDRLRLLVPMRIGAEPKPASPVQRSRLALDMHSLALGDLGANYGLQSRTFKTTLSPDGKQIQFTTRITLDEQTGESVAVTKTVTFVDDKYHMGVRIDVANLSKHNITPTYTLSAGTGIVLQDKKRPRLEAVAGKLKSEANIEVARMSVRKLAKGEPIPIAKCESWDIAWAGVQDKYFAAVLMPDKYAVPNAAQAILWGFKDESLFAELQAKHDRSAQRNSENVAAALRMAMPMLQAGERASQQFVFFAGPKKQSVLALYPGLTNLPSYGWFSGISKILLALLKGIYAIIPNYGVAIILLTFCVRLCLHPLSRKSQISMHKMQKLQPKINELKEKYKNNKRKQSEEQMKLFREHGANPMSGCLPMFFQIPVFFALFRALDLAIELRQTPFVLWINDLSQPDTLMKLPFPIPLLGTNLNVLPIVMCLTMFIQQRMMPRPADPNQAQQQKMMMYFMPFFFGFICYNMPSGLTLYWFTSTLLGIVEQKIIKAQLNKLG